jgi:folate-dependent phosphoribosylglycinamide formyltransferase PurN
MSSASPERLTVVALCERLAKAKALHNAVAGLDLEYRAVVCRNGRSLPRFIAAAALDCVRSWRIAVSVLSGRWQLSAGNLHGQRSVRFLGSCKPDVGLHATSVIYRRPVIDLFRLGILNPHIGLLPKYRGRSVMEWSLFQGDPIGITTFFIDEGIDTGPEIVLRTRFETAGLDRTSLKRFLFDQDVEMFRQALRALKSPGFAPERQEVVDGKRWYVMSHLFAGVVDDLLAQSSSSSTTRPLPTPWQG